MKTRAEFLELAEQQTIKRFGYFPPLEVDHSEKKHVLVSFFNRDFSDGSKTKQKMYMIFNSEGSMMLDVAFSDRALAIETLRREAFTDEESDRVMKEYNERLRREENEICSRYSK